MGEHVIPLWFINDFSAAAPFQSENSGSPYLKRDGDIAVQQNLPGTHVPMCSDCNGRLNTNIEIPAKPVIRKLLPQSPSHVWPTIGAGEAAAVGRWLLKLGLFLFHPEAHHDQPQVQQDGGLRRFDQVEQEWLTWMRQETDPPRDFTVYATRRSLLAGPLARPGPTRRVELPRLVQVGRRELRFMSRELGVRGLDATIVWHPGWPITHPLVADCRATVLWPDPAEIDFMALGEVHPDEFRFDLFTPSQTATQDNYQRWTAGHPLSEGNPPVIHEGALRD